jgi:hypothetical protein
MLDYLLLPALLGAGFSLGLCVVRPRKKLPSFWLALYAALATGACSVLLYDGLAVFSPGFWTGGKGPNALVAATMFGLGALAGFVPSLVVVLLYRTSKHD